MALAKTGPSRGAIRQFDLQVRRASTVSTACAYLTERGRFELPLPFRADRFSKPAHSTTLPPLRVGRERVSAGRKQVKRRMKGGDRGARASEMIGVVTAGRGSRRQSGPTRWRSAGGAKNAR